MGQGIDCRSPFAALGAHRPEELFSTLPTPCYILDEAQLRRNGKILSGVAARTGCKILLAQKAFSNYDLYPVLAPYLSGTEASGLYEARLGAEEMPGKEVHVFCAAYLPGGNRYDGTVPDNDGFGAVGKVFGELLLDKKAIYAVIVQAVSERGDLVITYQRQLRMQHGCAHVLRIDIGIIDLQNLLHSTAKIAKSAKLV